MASTIQSRFDDRANFLVEILGRSTRVEQPDARAVALRQLLKSSADARVKLRRFALEAVFTPLAGTLRRHSLRRARQPQRGRTIEKKRQIGREAAARNLVEIVK